MNAIIKSLNKVFKLNKESIEAPALRQKVREVYSKAAINPRSKFPFPVGRTFAEQVGYPKKQLDSFPDQISESFVGVSNVSIFADIQEGSAVLDIGCGAGLDSIIAAQKTGEKGKVVGIDFSEEMVEKAKKAISLTSYKNIEFHNAPAESLPFQSRYFDVVLANGIFNLNPFRDKIFKEIKRVLKPGGCVFAAEVVFAKPREHPDNVVKIDDWFAWIAGAREGVSFLKEFEEVGLVNAAILRTSTNDRAKQKKLLAADVSAQKPQ